MTRRDYELLAATVHSVKLDTNGLDDPESVLRLLSQRLADGLAQDNDRFDHDRFLSACGFGCEGLIDLAAPSGYDDGCFAYGCPECGSRHRVRASAFRGRTPEPARGAIRCGR